MEIYEGPLAGGRVGKEREERYVWREGMGEEGILCPVGSYVCGRYDQGDHGEGKDPQNSLDCAPEHRKGDRRNLCWKKTLTALPPFSLSLSFSTAPFFLPSLHPSLLVSLPFSFSLSLSLSLGFFQYFQSASVSEGEGRGQRRSSWGKTPSC